jgi:hypothetical protein
MVRCEDPPGADKHLRFGKISPDLLEILKEFPGVRAVVLHTHGKTGEHPHYHVFWSGKATTNQTIRNRLKAFNPIFQAYSGQNDWSFRNHDSYPKWVAYVTDNPTHKVELSDEQFDTIFDEIPKVPIVADSPLRNSTPITTDTIVHISSPRKKQLTSEEKMIAFITREYQWKLNQQWTLSKVQELAPKDTPDRLIRHQAFLEYSRICAEKVVHYGSGRFYNNQLIALTRNVMYLFGDDDLRDTLAAELASRIKSLDIV